MHLSAFFTMLPFGPALLITKDIRLSALIAKLSIIYMTIRMLGELLIFFMSSFAFKSANINYNNHHV